MGSECVGNGRWKVVGRCRRRHRSLLFWWQQQNQKVVSSPSWCLFTLVKIFFFIIILCLYYLAPCAIVGICLDSCLMVRIVESRSETSLGSFNKSTNQQPRCFICESTYFYDFLLLLRVDDDDDREEASSGIFFFFRLSFSLSLGKSNRFRSVEHTQSVRWPSVSSIKTRKKRKEDKRRTNARLIPTLSFMSDGSLPPESADHPPTTAST